MREHSFVSFIIFSRENSRSFPEVTHCAGGSRSSASRPSAGGTAAGGDFACGDQLTQLDRGRTESPARIKIAVAIFFNGAASRAFFILPAATGLRSRTAAGLKGKHKAIFGDAEHRGINLIFLNKSRLS